DRGHVALGVSPGPAFRARVAAVATVNAGADPGSRTRQSELAARRDRRIAAPVVGRGGRMVRDAGTAAPIHGRGVGADAVGKGRRAGSPRILLRFSARSFS